MIAILSLVIIAIYNIFFSVNQIPEAEIVKDTPHLKISVLNGCGISGAASEVKNYFIEKNLRNIDVIYWSNVERNLFIYNKTIIVVKKDQREKLEYLMELTDIQRRIFACNENSFEDMQIIVGKDYKRYFK